MMRETVKKIMFFVVFFGIVLLAGMFEDVSALMGDVQPLQAPERKQEIQVTKSVWVLQPTMRTDVAQETYNDLQGSTYEW